MPALIDAIDKENEGAGAVVNKALQTLTGMKMPLSNRGYTDKTAWQEWWRERLEATEEIKHILKACRLYAKEHQGNWPRDLGKLTPLKREGEDLSTKYTYIRPRRHSEKSERPPMVIYESFGVWKAPVNVGFADGRIDFIRDGARLRRLIEVALPPIDRVSLEKMKYLQLNGKKVEVNWQLRVIQRGFYLSMWFLQRGEEAREEHIATNISGMSAVWDIKASPNGKYLAVRSVGEGARLLEVIDLPSLLRERKYKVLRSICPFPGGIAIDRWDGDRLIVSSGALLTHSGNDGRVLHAVLGLMSAQTYALSIASGRIEALSPGAKNPIEYFTRKLSSTHAGERENAALALKLLKAQAETQPAPQPASTIPPKTYLTRIPDDYDHPLLRTNEWEEENIDKDELNGLIRSAIKMEDYLPTGVDDFTVKDINRDNRNEIVAAINAFCTSDPVMLVVLFKVGNETYLQKFRTEYGMIRDLKDLGGDECLEIVTKNTLAWSTDHMGAVCWREIYRWNGQRYVEASEDFPAFYRSWVEDLKKGIKRLSELAIDDFAEDSKWTEREFSKWQRFRIADNEVALFKAQQLLGDKRAGFERACQWSSSEYRELRRNAATVLAGIVDEESKRYLRKLAQDPGSIVALCAKNALKDMREHEGAVEGSKLIGVQAPTQLRQAKLLPGSQESLEKAMQDGFDLVGVCEAVHEAAVDFTDIGVGHAFQRFKVEELLAGSAVEGKAIDLKYTYLDIPSCNERAIENGERVIWIIRKEKERYRGVKAIADSLKNRQAVRAATAQAAPWGEPVEGVQMRMEIEKLSSRDAKTRALAAIALGAMGTKSSPATPHLIRLLGDEAKFDHRDVWQKATFFSVGGRSFGAYVAAEATGALAKIGTPAVDPLIAALKDRNAFVRTHAARALERIRDKRAVEPLCKALKDATENVRSAAAIALGEIGDSRAAQPLTALLVSDSADRSRQDAIDALVKLGEPATKAVIAVLRDWRRRGAASYVLVRTKDPHAVEPLIEDLKDENRHVRQGAALGLGAIGERRAADPLIELLEDPDPHVRAEAVQALGRIGGIPLEVYKTALLDDELQVRTNAVRALRRTKSADAVETLLDALGDKGLRNEAILALRDIRDSRAVPALIEILRDEDNHIRANAASVLGHFNDRRAVSPLIEALNDQNALVRARAGYALARLEDSQAVDALCKALGDEEPEVRVWAAIALRNIRDKQAVGALVEALKDPDWEVVIRAAHALGMIKDNRAVEPLVSVLEDELKNPWKIEIVRGTVKDSTDDLPWVGQGSDIAVTIAVVEALGWIGDERATQPLLAALSHNRWPVRMKAARALGNVKDHAAVAPLIAALKDLNNNNSVRRSAARALGQIKDIRAIEPLIAASKDNDVRADATSALRSTTGRDVGYTWEEWRTWWEKNKDKWQSPATQQAAQENIANDGVITKTRRFLLPKQLSLGTKGQVYFRRENAVSVELPVRNGFSIGTLVRRAGHDGFALYGGPPMSGSANAIGSYDESAETKSYTIEVFETSQPPSRFWDPRRAGDYKVLWKRTLPVSWAEGLVTRMRARGITYLNTTLFTGNLARIFHEGVSRRVFDLERVAIHEGCGFVGHRYPPPPFPRSVRGC